MNIARCMLRKCEQCRYEQSCFRKNTPDKSNNSKAFGLQNKKVKKF